MNETKSFKLTKNDAQEVMHKIGILVDNEDATMPDDSEISAERREELWESLLRDRAGEWTPPAWAVQLVCEEMQDHVCVLRDIAADARANCERDQALRINKQAAKFERLFVC